jgi:hypothetical protein
VSPSKFEIPKAKITAPAKKTFREFLMGCYAA